MEREVEESLRAVSHFDWKEVRVLSRLSQRAFE